MESFRRFLKKPTRQKWLKVNFFFILNEWLKRLIDEEKEKFHRELVNECGPDHCAKGCDFRNWIRRLNQIPTFECEVSFCWRDVIWTNRNGHGKVMGENSKHHLWSHEKREVAKVCMTDGHKNHNSVGDYDIAALLRLMNQRKHFEKFELGGLFERVANVRNNIMCAPKYQLEQKNLHDYFNRIREPGEVLAKHFPEYKSLSEDINEILILDYKLILPDDMAAQEFLKSQREKELDKLFNAVETLEQSLSECDKKMRSLEKELEDIHFEAAEHHHTRMKLERQIAQLEQDNLTDYYALTHITRGLCVIINNEEFKGTGLRNRRGTKEDERALRTVFTDLGFDVMIYNNLTAGEMRRELQQLGSRDFNDEDALVVCVLTHGEKGCVFGTDGQKVYLGELTQPFTSRRAPTLIGKPKLFFIQACQGSSYQRGSMPCPPSPRQEEGDRQIRLEEDAGPVDAGREDAGSEDAGHPGSMPCPPRPRQEERDKQIRLEEDAVPVRGETVPWGADFLLGMATVQECKSFRNISTGSIYIQELCRQLTMSAESLGKVDILDVLTRVNSEVSKGEFLNYKQMPEPKYTLTKKLVLKFV